MSIRFLRRTLTTLARPRNWLMTPSQSLGIAPASRIQPPTEQTISLTDIETQIFSLLDECTQHMKQEKGISTSCRVAGGWARDKVNRIIILDIRCCLLFYLSVTWIRK